MSWKQAILAGVVGVVIAVLIGVAYFLITGEEVSTSFLLGALCSWIVVHQVAGHGEDKDG